MDNLTITKDWEHSFGMELIVVARAEFISVQQSCYVDETVLREASERIAGFSANPQESCYIEFGEKEGKSILAFSMKLLPVDKHGYLNIEMDMEIDDNYERLHRACFFLTCTLTQITEFGKALGRLAHYDVGTSIDLVV